MYEKISKSIHISLLYYYESSSFVLYGESATIRITVVSDSLI